MAQWPKKIYPNMLHEAHVRLQDLSDRLMCTVGVSGKCFFGGERAHERCSINHTQVSDMRHVFCFVFLLQGGGPQKWKPLTQSPEPQRYNPLHCYHHMGFWKPSSSPKTHTAATTVKLRPQHNIFRWFVQFSHG